MSKKYDAIIILSNGLTKTGGLTRWNKAKLDKAVELAGWQTLFITTSRGTVHKPNHKNKQGFEVREATAMAEYLDQKSVNKRRILEEKYSLDTIGNAYFCRLLFTDRLRLKKLMIITADFHMPRSREIFEWVFSLKPLPFKYQLDFSSTPNIHIAKQDLIARKIKENQSLNQFQKAKKKIKNFKELTYWLFFEHKAYAHGGRPNKTKGKELNTY